MRPACMEGIHGTYTNRIRIPVSADSVGYRPRETPLRILGFSPFFPFLLIFGTPYARSRSVGKRIRWWENNHHEEVDCMHPPSVEGLSEPTLNAQHSRCFKLRRFGRPRRKGPTGTTCVIDVAGRVRAITGRGLGSLAAPCRSVASDHCWLETVSTEYRQVSGSLSCRRCLFLLVGPSTSC